jgi:hypothetical protein
MHRALDIADIFLAIVREVELLPPEAKPMKALQALALTCRSWSEYALHALWAHLDTSKCYFLARTMTPGTWKELTDEFEQKKRFQIVRNWAPNHSCPNFDPNV